LQFGYKEVNAVEVVREVELGDDNIPQEVDDHGRMIVFSHINGGIENLSGLMGSKHIPEIVKIIRSRLKYRVRHPYTSRKKLAQLFNIAFNDTSMTLT